MNEKREFRVTNAAAVSSNATWYAMGETGAPTDLQRSNYFPLKTLVFENLSGEPYDIILDPISATSGQKTYRVADGQTLMITEDDNITFYNIIAINQGALETAIGELRLTVRNY